jgi:hypothetical protein
MKTVSADFNATTQSEYVRLNLPCSRADLVQQKLGPGDWAWLSDGEIIVGARLAADESYGLVGVPDWDTIIHLDEADAENFVRVGSEMGELMAKDPRSEEDEPRILELMAQYEQFAPPELRISSAGMFSFRRALGLRLMGKPGLAMLEAREARKAMPGDPDVAFVYLDLLRHQDLASAVHEAELMAASSTVQADLLSGCINVLASSAEEAEGEEFESLARRILDWSDRLDRAPDRDEAEPSLLGLADFNRGLILLRLGRQSQGRQVLKRVESLLPVGPLRMEIAVLTTYDDRAREVARRVRDIAGWFPRHPVAA